MNYIVLIWIILTWIIWCSYNLLNYIVLYCGKIIHISLSSLIIPRPVLKRKSQSIPTYLVRPRTLPLTKYMDGCMACFVTGSNYKEMMGFYDFMRNNSTQAKPIQAKPSQLTYGVQTTVLWSLESVPYSRNSSHLRITTSCSHTVIL